MKLYAAFMQWTGEIDSEQGEALLGIYDSEELANEILENQREKLRSLADADEEIYVDEEADGSITVAGTYSYDDGNYWFHVDEYELNKAKDWS